jgi:Ca2+/Na+ antiporter
MNIFNLIFYVNKISLVLFFVVLGFLVYQFYLLKKEVDLKNNKQPEIPEFNEQSDIKQNYTRLKIPYQQENQEIKITEKKQAMPIFIALMAITLLIFFFTSFQNKNNETSLTEKNYLITPTPTFFLKKNDSIPTATITRLPDNSISPTPTIYLTPTTIQQKIVFVNESPTVEPTATLVEEKINTPTSINQLPISGVIDKPFFLFGLAFSMIISALIL